MIAAILDDARWAPSWSNTQPYRIAVAGGALKDQLKEQLLARFDAATKLQAGGVLGKLAAFLTYCAAC